MGTKHQETVMREFAKQAQDFGRGGLTLARADYLRWMVGNLGLQPDDAVLDVAAGTGHLSRAMAPHARRVTAFDLTPEMLHRARIEAEREGITNIDFAEGNAEKLPFADRSFDMVVTRFAVHHFEDPRLQVGEMARVCVSGGRVAVIDLITPDDPGLAAAYNRIERLRDPSHVRALTSAELTGLLHRAALRPVHGVSRDIEVNITPWFELTNTPPGTAEAIRAELNREIEGACGTGMRPFRRGGELFITQTWRIVVGEKAGEKP